MFWSITRPQAQSSEAPKKRRSERSFQSQGYHCGFEVSWFAQQIPGKPGLYCKTLAQQANKQPSVFLKERKCLFL